MTNRFELYKCSICGNVIEILVSGDGHPVCCGEEMEKLENKNDTKNSPELTKTHTPVIETDGRERIISVPNHPMSKEHHIVFLQSISNDKTEACIKFLQPEEKTVMKNCSDTNKIHARSYCNIHGVYIS
ncbi:MAG: desulfoferrodoxin FeS4 iron-binding domain-containing protein [Cyanobacteria bacterium RUI128]|nr:desulfoferrodoxin FeS4 iron-binding domain-containing protein [Cyanobacteria bacterium RUI128]